MIKMFKKYKWLKWVILAAVLLIIVWAVFLQAKATVTIRAAKAVIGEIAPAVSVSGEIRGNAVEMGSKMGGVITWIGVKEGDAVSAGQTLIKFDGYENAKSDFERTMALYKDGYATKQQFEVAKLHFENSKIDTPIRGVVTQVNNDLGETATPGMPVVSVIDPLSAYAQVQIDEADIGDVKQGQEVNIFADAYPDETFTGILGKIGQEAELKKIGGRIKLDEEDKIFRARVNFSDPEYKLKIGMTINADLITEKKPGLLIIPREAIVTKQDKQKVFVIKGNRAKETDVQFGARDAVNIEVKSGIKEGDQVAVTGFDKLKNGSPVKVEKE